MNSQITLNIVFKRKKNLSALNMLYERNNKHSTHIRSIVLYSSRLHIRIYEQNRDNRRDVTLQHKHSTELCSCIHVCARVCVFASTWHFKTNWDLCAYTAKWCSTQINKICSIQKQTLERRKQKEIYSRFFSRFFSAAKVASQTFLLFVVDIKEKNSNDSTTRNHFLSFFGFISYVFFGYFGWKFWFFTLNWLASDNNNNTMAPPPVPEDEKKKIIIGILARNAKTGCQLRQLNGKFNLYFQWKQHCVIFFSTFKIMVTCFFVCVC